MPSTYNETHQRVGLVPETATNDLVFASTGVVRYKYAIVVELVDTLDLGSSAARRESSSLSDRTSLINNTMRS